MGQGSRDRYGQADVMDSNKLVPEGIEGQVPYKGSLAFNIHQLVGGLRAGMGYLGCRDVATLRQQCQVHADHRGGVPRRPCARCFHHQRSAQLQSRMILVLDFGSQYTQLIARRIRESKVYCEIHPFNLAWKKLPRSSPKESFFPAGRPAFIKKTRRKSARELFQLPVPFLGICYGMGIVNLDFGGEGGRADRREYGPADLLIDSDADLFHGFSQHDSTRVWMSHGDKMISFPEGVASSRAQSATRRSPRSPIRRGAFSACSFIPKWRTRARGREVLDNFVFRICGAEPDWTMEHFIETSVKKIREQVGDGRVLCALSGGVDSSVAATLIHRAIKDRLICVFVNNGLLRKDEAEQVCSLFVERFGQSFRYVDASEAFLAELKDVEDPEVKRKRIGYKFIEVFEEASAQARRDRVSRPGHALSRRDRVGFGARVRRRRSSRITTSAACRPT